MPNLPDGGFLALLISKLAPKSEQVRDWVEQIKVENPDLTKDEIAEYICDYIVWQFTKQGAALALPGAIPGLGTVLQISAELTTISADIALMIRNQTYIVFALGECYGIKGRETLLQDSLICMGLWTNSIILTRTGAVKLGTKVVEANFKKRFPAKIFQAINKRVGRTILTKYGTKRGGAAIGKLIPFGVAVGGGFNYITMKRFATKSIKYFSLKIG